MSSFDNIPPGNGGDGKFPDPSNDQSRLKAAHDALRDEHERLDRQIAELELSGAVNSLELQRLKREKLQLKDKIAELSRWITPDIIA